MAASGEQAKAGASLGRGFRLGQDAASNGNDSVRGKDEVAWGGRGICLLLGEPFCVGAGQFSGVGGFIDFLRSNTVRDNANLRQQSQTARAGGRED
jgi:hypothetical protein